MFLITRGIPRRPRSRNRFGESAPLPRPQLQEYLRSSSSVQSYMLRDGGQEIYRYLGSPSTRPLSSGDSRFRTPLLYAGAEFADKEPTLSPEAAAEFRIVRDYFFGALRNMEWLVEFKWNALSFSIGAEETSLI